jgi:glycosyltransferase involved in cell wall biosynthesis
MAARIRDFADRAGLQDRITLHGFLGRDELLRLMRECQVVAAPTVWPEPFGRTPLEAALARRPIVAFAQGGLAESIRDGETGFLVPPGDYRAFLERVDRLVAEPVLRHAMGVAALAHVSATFSPDRATRLLAEALFDGAVAPPS